MVQQVSERRMLESCLETSLFKFWWIILLIFPPGPESKVKKFGLITLGEFSKQPNIDCELWLLVIIVMRIYNEMEQVYQRKLQNKIWGEKKRQEVELSSVLFSRR